MYLHGKKITILYLNYLIHGNTVIIYTKIQRDQMHHGEESLCCKFSIQKVLPPYKLSSSYFVYIPVLYLLLIFFFYFFNLVTNACTWGFINIHELVQYNLLVYISLLNVFQEKQICINTGFRKSKYVLIQYMFFNKPTQNT